MVTTWAGHAISASILIASNWEKKGRDPRRSKNLQQKIGECGQRVFFADIVPLRSCSWPTRHVRHFYIAYSAIPCLFCFYSVRLAVTQHRLSISSEAVNLAEARFRSCSHKIHSPSGCFDLESLNLLEVTPRRNANTDTRGMIPQDEGFRSTGAGGSSRSDRSLLRAMFPECYFRAHHRRKDGTAMAVQVSAQAMELRDARPRSRSWQNISENWRWKSSFLATVAKDGAVDAERAE